MFFCNITRFFDLVPRSRFGGSRTKIGEGGGEGRGGNEIWQNVISSPDLVLAVRGQKNGGVGSGRERRKRDLAKCDLVPRSRFGGSRTKKRGSGEWKGEEETRSGKM